MVRVLPFLVLILVSPLPVVAQAVPFQPGEVLSVEVYGQPDLSGERQIDETGRIALPFVGRIDAAGTEPEALESRITARLAEAGFEDGAIVTVTAVRRLDVYVDGAVGSPGAQVWRPGLTIDQLLALAGGRILLTTEELGPALQALRSVEYASGLEQRLRTLQLVQARLNAENSFIDQVFSNKADGKVAVESLLVLPDAVVRDPLLADLMTTERQILADWAERSQSAHAALLAQIEIQQDRRKALESRATSLDEVLALVRERLDAVRTLGDKGLASRDDVVTVTQAYANTVAEQLNVASALAETRSRLQELEQSLSRFGADLASGVDEELRAAQAELADVASRLDPALRAAALSKGYEGAGIARAGTVESGGSQPETLLVLRGSGSGQRQILAIPGFVLMPGDTVIVPFAPQG
ncbi:polysaccharide biosynthesis/export family protein [Rhodobacter ferrooxidans]|uniref:Polysaccharide export protein n=1 Tax=Rhodobacter ferrooxidans TaxID=371731 RepID=C8S4B1_9RHOB|nr:polysaccharide biosynthesis/export family protein [Rhodobacter sp. SW2]EEW24170.1 polysaccharide export protein [Rhodobacter sp. SW2]